MNIQKELSGGILVLIINRGQGSYYFGDNSYWLLDDWEPEVAAGTYLGKLDSMKVYPMKWPSSFLKKYRPELIINLDQKMLLSNYYDQALENRVPHDWEGRWIENKEDFIKHIPIQDRYWEECT